MPVNVHKTSLRVRSMRPRYPWRYMYTTSMGLAATLRQVYLGLSSLGRLPVGHKVVMILP